MKASGQAAVKGRGRSDLAAPPAIALMVKAPRPGSVKTRLAESLGAERACAVYRWMAERQVAALPRGWPVTVHFAPVDAEAEMRRWLGSRLNYEAQPAGDLGKRMLAAARSAFAAGARQLVLVGADCPALECADLELVAQQLRNGADIVFGPATDGGYYLMGMRRFEPEVFAGIPWSSAETLSRSVARCAALQLRVATLAVKEDVDDEASLRRAIEAGLVPGDLAGPASE